MTNIKVPLSSNDWNNTGRNPEQHTIIVATIEWIVIILIATIEWFAIILIATIEWFAIILIATIEWKRARCVLSFFYCDNDTTTTIMTS